MKLRAGSHHVPATIGLTDYRRARADDVADEINDTWERDVHETTKRNTESDTKEEVRGGVPVFH